MSILLFILVVVLNVVDIITTNKIISNGGKELNPFVKLLMRILGKRWWLPKVAMIISISGLMTFGDEGAIWLTILNVIYLAIVYSNLRQSREVASQSLCLKQPSELLTPTNMVPKL